MKPMQPACLSLVAILAIFQRLAGASAPSGRDARLVALQSGCYPVFSDWRCF